MATKIKAIVEVDSQDKVIKYWENSTDAAKELHINKGLINMLLEGKIPKAAKRRFRWATASEVARYRSIVADLKRKQKAVSTFTESVAPLVSLSEDEIIPAKTKRPVYDADNLSPFEQMVAEAKAKKVL